MSITEDAGWRNRRRMFRSTQVDLNPSHTKKKSRNVRIDFLTLFLNWYKIPLRSFQVSYLLRLCNFCKAPRDMQKFPQNCQKITGY